MESNIFSCAVDIIREFGIRGPEPSRPVVREEREIIVNGLKEQWRLEC